MSLKSIHIPKFNQKGGAYETLYYIIGLIILIFVVITVYLFSYGYTIRFGWKNLLFMFEKGNFNENNELNEVDQTREPEPTPMPAPPESPPPPPAVPSPTLPPRPPSQTPDIVASLSNNNNLPFSPEERPNGMPGAQKKEPDIITNLFNSESNDSLIKSGGVFNVSRNIYKYEDAAPLCKAMGAELATYDQIIEAYKHGADWCNYGWIKGQMAVFPTQDNTWKKLQSGPSEYRFSCGKPGVNGGFFDNPDLTFGVNCFGKRPIQNEADDLQNLTEFTIPQTVQQIEFDKKVQKFRETLGNVTVLPFSRNKWSD